MTDQAMSIRKTTLLRAPLSRVWAAISDSARFGAWFGAEFDGPFVAGTTVTARIRPTTVDAEVARLQAPHAGLPFEVQVERVEAPTTLAFRWAPHGTGAPDHPGDPTTLVTFTLSAEGDDTRLTIVESGFEQVPLERRAQAFTANDGGWEHQTRLIGLYLARA